MVQRGAENAERNALRQLKFFSQDLTKDFSHHSWANQGFDALLIDPPRAGAEEIMHYMPNFGAKESFTCRVIRRHSQGMRGCWYNRVID